MNRRVIDFPLLGEQDAKVIMSIGVIGVEAQRLLIACPRLGVSPQRGQRVAQIVLRIGAVGS
jgi:hypothetical protein